jgi:glutamate/tyrosine decarboxylase-like PLP-dependent enzyme
MDQLFSEIIRCAGRYLAALPTRGVGPTPEAVSALQKLDVPLQEHPLEPAAVLTELDEIGSNATVACAGGRYFGFVTGGALPASLAANMLAAVWDQNAVLEIASPVAAFIEEVGRKWLVSLLGLPPQAAIGFATGATMANFSGLAAARHALLERQGWDVEANGLFGAPPIEVIVGEEVHVSVLKALSMLGLGRDRVVRIPTDDHGRMRADLLPSPAGPAIICIQAGNVNTGAFDPAEAICLKARKTGAWVHVDGAFGLWAAATPEKSALATGVELADSWATDAHKWLNVPYDSGLVFVREARHLLAAMSSRAAYLIEGEKREPSHYVPELSRRARGVEIWAALRSLGRAGLSDLIERCCKFAVRFAEGLRNEGIQVLNDVVLNQVLVKFGNENQTRRVIRRIQDEGTCWCGETIWQGQVAMRISVSSWATTADDVEKSLAAILGIAAREEKDEDSNHSGTL